MNQIPISMLSVLPVTNLATLLIARKDALSLLKPYTLLTTLVQSGIARIKYRKQSKVLRLDRRRRN